MKFSKRKKDVITRWREIVANSGLFDASWYQQRYPDIGDFDPVHHYVLHGAYEGRQPSAHFDGPLYFRLYPDVEAERMNPIVHWILHGLKEGRKYPSAEAAPSPAVRRSIAAPARIAMKPKTSRSKEEESRSKIIGSGLFDPTWYREHNPDIGNYDPAMHYVRHGAAEGRPASRFFDAAQYLADNPDVHAAMVNPLLHWIEHGHNEGRKSPLISAPQQNASGILEFCNPDRLENPREIIDETFKISVITPTYNTDPLYLKELYYSLKNQTYANWEWAICDDGSTLPETLHELRRLAADESRLVIDFQQSSNGISGASNRAIAISSGDYLALVDHDDLLARDIFEKIWTRWRETPDCDLFYTDECKISLDRTLYDFYHKPDWSPILLESTMYIGHLSVYRRDRVVDAGGFRSEFDGTQDFDLALRLSKIIQKVIHIESVGYLWRAIPGSSAMALSEKGYAIARQEKAVTDCIQGFAPSAKVRPGPSLGYWRTEYALSGTPLLSLVIPTGAGHRIVRGESVDLLVNCISSMIARRFYPNLEFVIIHNGDLSEKQKTYLEALDHVTLVHYADKHLNLARKMNLGVEHARGDYVCLLNDDVEAITEAAGDAMIGFLQAHPGVGAIGPLCLYENGTVQHNGILLLEQGPSHSGIHKDANFGGHFNYLRLRREAFGVTGALLITRRAHYLEVGGFSEVLPLNYNDVDFCAKLRAIGLTSVVDPEIQVHHFESATKVGTFKCEKEMLFKLLPETRDPYFNSNFDQRNPYYVIDMKRNAEIDNISFERMLDEQIRSRSTGDILLDATFTVAVSVYNQPKQLLQEMLSSIVHQTYDNVEILILDNGSSNPETLTWIAAIESHPKVRLIRVVANTGIMGGQKLLLDHASGDYFLPMDADDFITIDCVEIMARVAHDNPNVHVFYSDEFKSDTASNKFAPFHKGAFDSLKITNCCYVGHQMMFRTAFLREIGGYSDDRAAWCHDWDSTFRTLQAGESVLHVPELLYAWRINPGSTASVETGQKPETVSSQRFVLDRYLAAQGCDDKLVAEPNLLGSNTGMWSLRALAPLDNLAATSAETLWSMPRDEAAATLNALCDTVGEQGWIAILLDAVEPREALLALSAPCHLDATIKVVGSCLTNEAGEVVWAGGEIGDTGVTERSLGLDPRTGGYHGILYCQRLTNVVACANMLVRSDILKQALTQCDNALNPDHLMVHLARQAKSEGWKIATTPRLQAILPKEMRWILPVDRDNLIVQPSKERPKSKQSSSVRRETALAR